MFTAEKLRLLRQAKQMKQKEMARKLGISQQRYSALENNEKISEEKTKRILSALCLSKKEAEKILKIFYRTTGK